MQRFYRKRNSHEGVLVLFRCERLLSALSYVIFFHFAVLY